MRKDSAYFNVRHTRLLEQAAKARTRPDNPRAISLLVANGINQCRVKYSRGDSLEQISATATQLGADFCDAQAKTGVGGYKAVHAASLLALFAEPNLRAEAAEATSNSAETNLLANAILTMEPLASDDLSEILPFYHPYAEALTGNSDATSFFDWVTNSWYNSNREQAWYESHIDAPDYDGYWCFEGAAVAKIMSFDTTGWESSVYWPPDLPA